MQDRDEVGLHRHLSPLPREGDSQIRHRVLGQGVPNRDEVGLHGHPSLLPREVKEIHKYGIAFWDKECRVVMK